MASSSNKTVTLRSFDGDMFEVQEHVALQCETIKYMIEDGCADSVIPISNVNSKTLAKVIEYCREHAVSGCSQSDHDRTSQKKLREWDKEFVNVDRETLFDIIMAANYLSIKGLLDLTCQTMADMIKDKSVEEIRGIFNIINDYTTEEEAEVRKEYQWAFDEQNNSGEKK